MQGYEVKWYEHIDCMEAEGINQDTMDHATKNSEILEDLQNDWNTLCDMEMAVLCLPWYAYLEKHSGDDDDDDDDDNDLSNDMLRSNAENHKTATRVKALHTVSCAPLPTYCSDPLNTFPVNFILHIFRASILHAQYVLPTCWTTFILLLIFAPTCLGHSHIFRDLVHLKKH